METISVIVSVGMGWMASVVIAAVAIVVLALRRGAMTDVTRQAEMIAVRTNYQNNGREV